MRAAVLLGVATVAVGIWGYWLSSDRVSVEKAPTPQPLAPELELLEGIGSYQMDVSIKDERALQWFNQGLNLAYGFNHQAALQSFEQAAKLDPRCAMCWWGAALVLGPHPNAGMRNEDYVRAHSNVRKALMLSVHATEREQAYIAALDRRYSREAPISRRLFDEAYVDAMRELVSRYPDDIDARALLAEALMTLHPWDYQDGDRQAQPWTQEISDLLLSVIGRNPDHPAAHHLLIHVYENSETPESAKASAIRLGQLAPAAGHMQHVPAHLHMRLGDYPAAVKADQAAVQADKAFLERWPLPKGLYGWAYIGHHLHSLYASSMMLGQSAQCISAADELAAQVNLRRARRPAYSALQHLWVSPYLARIRFEKWDELIAEPAPPADLAYPTAIWHYARGLAYVARHQMARASAELLALSTIAVHPDLEKTGIWGQTTFSNLLQIAVLHLEAEIKAQGKQYRESIRLLRTAVTLEDALPYNYPAHWFFPLRHVLGEVLLAAGNPQSAREVYLQDLQIHPENGWALSGLVQSLKRQGLPADAVEKRFEAAWALADVGLKTGSRY